MNDAKDAPLVAILVLAYAARTNSSIVKIARYSINKIIRSYWKTLRYKNAWDLSSKKAQSAKETIKEHMVPVRVLVEHILTLDNLRLQINPTNISLLKYTLTVYSIIVRIAKHEDKRLNARHLKQSMPSGWVFGMNPISRYEAAGIKVYSDNQPWSLYSPTSHAGCYKYSFFLIGQPLSVMSFYIGLRSHYYSSAIIEITPFTPWGVDTHNSIQCTVLNSVPLQDFRKSVNLFARNNSVKIECGRL